MDGEAPKPASVPTGAVFLSYASQDAEAAQRICEALRSAGIDVWFDQSELRGGDAWDRQIRKQIHDCGLFVPVISVHSDARQEGYFRREWRLAVERAGDMAEDVAFLVPVVIDSTKDATARVPDRFREVQWSHVPDGHVPPAFIERIRRLLSPEPSHATTIALKSVNPVARTPPVAGVLLHSWRSRATLLATALVLIVGGAYLVVDRFVLSKRAAHVSASLADKSIAVLPFTDLSEKHDQEYFADGLAEEIVDLLAKIPGLKVIGRTSSFQFKRNTGDLRKIGVTLNASHIVEGSVRKLGDRVRVTVQLIEAADGTHRWSETYDRDSKDILSLQREIATAVARQLQVSVSDYFGPGNATKSAEAYDLYLRGIRDVDTYNQGSVRRAIADFSQAVERDPTYVNAWVGLADAYDVAASTRASPYAEAYRQGRLAADKALALDPRNADAYATRAFIRMNQWDWQSAEEDIRRSLDLRRTGSGLQAAARLATVRGQLTEGERLLLNVLALDPLDTYTLSELAGWVYPAMGRFEEADQLYLKLKDLDPGYNWFNSGWAILKVLEGNYPVALQLAEADPEPEAKETALALVYSGMGKPEKSKQALERLQRIPTASAYSIACVHAYRGEKDLALQSLEAAYQQQAPDLIALKIDPLLARLRSDQRYHDLVRRMNLPD